METMHDYDEAEESPQRFVSIDALRGFDMFWIIGAGSIVHALRGISDAPPVKLLADQLEHVDWAGFHFYDLIFPLFVFLMGTSTVFSLDRIVAEKGRGAALLRVVRRAVVLYLLGLLYYGALSRDGGPEMFRYVGVLQRIAICYLFGGSLYLFLRVRGLVIASVLLLGGYCALLSLYPVPYYGPGDFGEGANLTNFVDTHYLPGYKWDGDGDWDPEGLLSNLPAVASGLLGIFAGLLLRNRELSNGRRIGLLVALGAVCLLGGVAWHPYFPIIKKLWTSSFVLYAAGWSFLLVALFHAVIDVARFDIWARPFVWIGMNPIALYMLGNLIGGYRGLLGRVIHQPVLDATAPWGQFVASIAAAMIPIGIAYVMYRKRVFIRV